MNGQRSGAEPIDPTGMTDQQLHAVLEHFFVTSSSRTPSPPPPPRVQIVELPEGTVPPEGTVTAKPTTITSPATGPTREKPASPNPFKWADAARLRRSPPPPRASSSLSRSATLPARSRLGQAPSQTGSGDDSPADSPATHRAAAAISSLFGVESHLPHAQDHRARWDDEAEREKRVIPRRSRHGPPCRPGWDDDDDDDDEAGGSSGRPADDEDQEEGGVASSSSDDDDDFRRTQATKRMPPAPSSLTAFSTPSSLFPRSTIPPGIPVAARRAGAAGSPPDQISPAATVVYSAEEMDPLAPPSTSAHPLLRPSPSTGGVGGLAPRATTPKSSAGVAGTSTSATALTSIITTTATTATTGGGVGSGSGGSTTPTSRLLRPIPTGPSPVDSLRPRVEEPDDEDEDEDEDEDGVLSEMPLLGAPPRTGPTARPASVFWDEENEEPLTAPPPPEDGEMMGTPPHSAMPSIPPPTPWRSPFVPPPRPPAPPPFQRPSTTPPGSPKATVSPSQPPAAPTPTAPITFLTPQARTSILSRTQTGRTPPSAEPAPRPALRSHHASFTSAASPSSPETSLPAGPASITLTGSAQQQGQQQELEQQPSTILAAATEPGWPVPGASTPTTTSPRVVSTPALAMYSPPPAAALTPASAASPSPEQPPAPPFLGRSGAPYGPSTATPLASPVASAMGVGPPSTTTPRHGEHSPWGGLSAADPDPEDGSRPLVPPPAPRLTFRPLGPLGGEEVSPR
ncbi:hypothetical protein PAPYR_2392 [Paratrimastix pyriformis]|uniref:Uncharacterized protein n=1 Tax=Paratrimastix pyriformis TaxID=342808 RepID=A0ABQ8UX41_9EUKA|nr:hypothetical protein PAPYR_2392 [Paratrimastix pyriformis]